MDVFWAWLHLAGNDKRSDDPVGADRAVLYVEVVWNEV